MGTRVSIHSPTFTGCWFVLFFLKQLVLASIRRQTSTNDSHPGGKKLTRKAATQVQRGTYGTDNGALTGAPLCRRRWHVSPPRSRSSVVLGSDRERGGWGEDKKIHFAKVTTSEPKELEPAGRGVGEAGEGKPGTLVVRCRGKARGPIPDGLAVAGSIRGNSCAPLPKIRSAQLASSASAGE